MRKSLKDLAITQGIATLFIAGIDSLIYFVCGMHFVTVALLFLGSIIGSILFISTRIIAEYRENIRLAEICGAELEDVYFARNELKWQKGYIEQNAQLQRTYF